MKLAEQRSDSPARAALRTEADDVANLEVSHFSADSLYAGDDLMARHQRAALPWPPVSIDAVAV